MIYVLNIPYQYRMLNQTTPKITSFWGKLIISIGCIYYAVILCTQQSMIGSGAYALFISHLEVRSQMKLTSPIEEQLEFEELTIKKEFDKAQPHNKKRRRLHLSDEFVQAFEELNKAQRVDFYCTQVEILKQVLHGVLPHVSQQPSKKIEVYVRGGTLRSWKRKSIQVVPLERVLLLEGEDGVPKNHNLCNYIYRKSKNNDYFSFVLQSVNSQAKGKYKTIHLGFSNINHFNIAYQEVKSAIQYNFGLTWANELGIKIDKQGKRSQTEPNEKKPIEVNQLKPGDHTKLSPSKTEFVRNDPQAVSQPTQDPRFPQPQKQPPIPAKHQPPHEDLSQSKIINSIIHESIQLKTLDEDQQYQGTSRQSKHFILNQLLPHYDLDSLLDQDNMTTIECEGSHRLLQQNNNKRRFKVFLTIPSKTANVFACVINPDYVKKWNPQVEDFSLKNVIKSENTAIIYMKLKNYSAIYRGRDFLFLRHAFKRGDNLYLVDKSIESIDYPPFMTIVRGELTAVWGFIQNKGKNQTLLVVDITLNNQGILNEQQNTNLALRYLQKIQNIENYIVQRTIKGEEFLAQVFDLDWVTQQRHANDQAAKVSNNKSEWNQTKVQSDNFKSIISPQTATLDQGEDKVNDWSEDKPSKEQKPTVEPRSKQEGSIKHQFKESDQKGELDLMEKLPLNRRIPQLDGEGFSVINWNCIKVKHRLVPWQRQIIIDEDYIEHQFWKGEWKHDNNAGGLWYKDEVKMNAQKKVLGYIVKKMGSNLLKGKGILSISLPVDVFSLESNLERVARTFTYAPLGLEKVCNQSNPIEQLKQVLSSAFTSSLLYVSMQKPFNPVLGETFQGSINGCPIYLEQVSHHPPIAAFYFVGRGYRFYGSIESKMQLSVNSGCGTNEGDFVIEFQNGNVFKFRTAGGEISGLTFGDRKLNLIGKGYVWCPNKQLILQLNNNPDKKGYFSIGKAETPSDYVEGVVKKVTKEFMNEFQGKKVKTGPTAKDTLEQLNKVSGTWTNQICMDGKPIFVVDSTKYIKFQYQPNPLPSDSNYREDIIYRRLNNIPRSQNQKERIQVRQREDRKLREKFTGKGH